ncbi:MAG: TolC family protein [Pseudomonadales bacterium]
MRVFPLACALLLAGCASLPPQPPTETLREQVAERADVSTAQQRDPEARRRAAEEVAALLQAPLTREAAVQVALLNNRQVQALFAELDVAAADYFDTVTPRNPVLDLEALRPEGGGRAALELELTQSILGLLTRRSRMAAAQATLETRELEAVETMLALIRGVEVAFLRAQADAETAAMLRYSVAATEAAVVAAEALYDAGNVTRLTVARERQLHEETRLRLMEAEARRRSSDEALNRQLGLQGADTRRALQSRVPALPDDGAGADMLEAEAVASSVRLAALRTQVDAASRAAGLADATALLPEVTVGATAERDSDGTWAYGPRLQLPLPLLDRGQGRRGRAWANLEALSHTWRHEVTALRSHVREAADRYRSAREQALHARDVLMPLSSRVLQLTLLDYNAMESDPFDLLLARRGQIEAGLRHIETRRAYWVARLDLENLRRGGAAGGG